MSIDCSEKKDGGIMKEIIKEGTGEAHPSTSCNVHVHYHGTLLDGTVFDSSRERGEIFKFDLGVGQVIKAWDQGVATMKKGEIARLTCLPEYAYGAGGSPPKIPPNATLVFEVELIDWVNEDLSPESDGSIQRQVITKGELYSTPEDLSECTMHIRGEGGDGKIFDERDVTFVVGEAHSEKICRGLEIAVQKMKKGEKSKIILSGQYAKDEHLPKGVESPSFTVTLHKFEKAKDCWQLNSDQKFVEVEKDKAKGTEHLKAGRLAQALKYYKRVRDFMESETSLEGEEKTKRDQFLLSALLNMSLVHLKENDNVSCIEICDKILEIDPKSVKALFRRGQAHLNSNDFTDAVKDFEKCVEIEPDNKAALSQIQIAKNKSLLQLEKEKKMYRAMFQKLSAGEGKSNGSQKAPEEGVWTNEQAKA